MYTQQINNISPLCILCVLMPQIIPFLTLTIIHARYEEPTPWAIGEPIMAACDFYECAVLDGVLSSGGWLLSRAFSTHKMPGLSLARQVHGVRVHVHCGSHSRIVMSWGLQFQFPSLIKA
jgi:hypothetical protein